MAFENCSRLSGPQTFDLLPATQNSTLAISSNAKRETSASNSSSGKNVKLSLSLSSHPIWLEIPALTSHKRDKLIDIPPRLDMAAWTQLLARRLFSDPDPCVAWHAAHTRQPPHREGIKKERCDACLHLFAYCVTVHCFPINFKIKICKLAKAHLKEPSQQWSLAAATCSTLSPLWSASLSFLYLRRLNKVNMSGYNITDH